MTKKKRFYLREGDDIVGPFCSREDAGRFLILMELYGGGRQGIELVELNSPAQPDGDDDSVPDQGCCPFPSTPCKKPVR